jgi:hypothetical protein
MDDRLDLERLLSTLATKDDLRELRRHMDILGERLRSDIHALIDAIELLKYIDSQPR